MACPRRRVQGSLQPLRYRHRRHERAQETTRVVRHVQGHHSLYRRQTPPRGAGAEARPGAYRPRRAQAVTTSDAHRAIDAVWRIESAKLIAGLTRIVRDVALAEDLAQDALVAALERWPTSGVPDNPGAWLMATAKHRAIDLFRRNERLERKQEELGRDLELRQEMTVGNLDTATPDDVGDDLLRLMFISCHQIG